MTNRDDTGEDTVPAAQMPPLIMLRAFEATGRTGSMRKAADNIGVSHTVVSRHVRNLEAWMGCKLVQSGPRGAVLTDEGASLFASVTQAFQLIANAASDLRPRHRNRGIRIWCVPGLASRWLAPRISRLEELFPGANVMVRSTTELPDFSRSQADLAIGFGDFDDLPAAAVPLLRPRMFPVVSANWIADRGVPDSPERLPRLPLIHEESHRQWRNWFEAAGIAAGTLGGPRLGDANLGLDAAMSGQGIALASRILTRRELDAANLTELFDTDIRLGGYYLVVAPARRSDPAIVRLRDWIQAELALSEASGD